LWYNAPKLLPAGVKESGGIPRHRPATTFVHYTRTTSCKTQSSVPEDGQKIARNMLS